MKSNVAVISASYTVKYTNKEPVPISDIIRSLKSTERLLQRTPPFVEKAFKGVKVLDVKVFVEELESGSLYERFVIKYVVGGEENHEKLKEVIDTMMNNGALKVVVASGFAALATYGVMSASSPGAPTTHIEDHSTNIVNIVTAGENSNLTGADINAILSNITDKKTLAKEAVDFIKPAKSDPHATIEMADIPELTIKKDFIKQAPSDYEPPVQQEKDESYDNVDVDIIASDRENYDKGWAGTIANLVNNRTKIELDDAVYPSKVHGKTKVRADVVITSRFQKSKKKYVPHLIHIKVVH